MARSRKRHNGTQRQQRNCLSELRIWAGPCDMGLDQYLDLLTHVPAIFTAGWVRDPKNDELLPVAGFFTTTRDSDGDINGLAGYVRRGNQDVVTGWIEWDQEAVKNEMLFPTDHTWCVICVPPQLIEPTAAADRQMVADRYSAKRLGIKLS